MGTRSSCSKGYSLASRCPYGQPVRRARRTPEPTGSDARSDGVAALFTGPDADGPVDGHQPDLAVADLSGLRRPGDGVGDLVGIDAVAQDLDLDLGDEIDLVLGAPIGLGVAALATETPGLGHRHAADPHLVERLLHRIQLVRLDDGDNQVEHGAPSSVRLVSARQRSVSGAEPLRLARTWPPPSAR